MFSTLVLQNGPIKEYGVNGDQIEELIKWCQDRLIEFNQPPYYTVETAIAIQHLELALERLLVRTAKRQQRGVEGTSTP